MELDRAAFEVIVGEALDDVPEEFLDLLDNVVFLVEDEPPPEEGADLLGLYEGVPKTERCLDGSPLLPDRITLFAGPLSRACDSVEELREEVAVTVVHEIAHHFGIDDDRLTELGWD